MPSSAMPTWFAGELELAGLNYTAALRIAPHLTACWCNLGNVQMQSGNAEDAIALYLQALKTNAAHWPSRTNLAQALIATGKMDEAKALLDGAGAGTAAGQRRVASARQGVLRAEGDRSRARIISARRSALNPRDADSLYWIGAIRQQYGDAAAARAAYSAAAQIQPVIRRRAIKSPADFRVLALYAPFAGNTPAEYLFKDACYDTDTLALFDLSRPEVSTLGVVRSRRQSDLGRRPGRRRAAAGGRSRRPARQACHQRSRRIVRTTRDEVAGLLPDIAGCRIPKILRLGAASDVCRCRARGGDAVFLPAAGAARGHPWRRRFREDRGRGCARDYLRPREGDHYLIEYVDYASRDGSFPQISLHLRRRENPALSSGDRKRLEGASRLRPTWPIMNGCSRRRRRSWPIPAAVFSAVASRDAARDPRIASGSIISASIAGSIATANSSCSRSMPRCWCTSTMRRSPTRIPTCPRHQAGVRRDARGRRAGKGG